MTEEKTHLTFKDFKPSHFLGLVEILRDSDARNLIEKKGVADHGYGPAVGYNGDSGYLYVPLECLDICICTKKDNFGNWKSPFLHFHCGENGDEFYSSRTLEVAILGAEKRILKNGEVEGEYPSADALKWQYRPAYRIFKAWEDSEKAYQKRERKRREISGFYQRFFDLNKKREGIEMPSLNHYKELDMFTVKKWINK